MIPPIIYRILNPNLQGLEPEGAYMMLCQRILPAGLIGLVLAGMISATSSKANTTINLAATVFSTDLYKNLIRPHASEKELILMARIFTLVFGAATVGIALVIPSVGGIVDFVLSVASIAGGALFAPIIWSLFSKRQTSLSVVTATLAALLINVFFKMVTPSLFNLKLSRTVETILGQAIPVLVLFAFEMYYRRKGMVAPRANVFTTNLEQVPVLSAAHHEAAKAQNIFGIRVISISMGFVGIGIITLGSIASYSSKVVITVGALIMLLALFIGKLTMKTGTSKVKISPHSP